MPRPVDSAEKRDELTDAALALAAREGLGAVTLARVAQAVGASKGRVQHRFGTKRELLLQTGIRLDARITARLMPPLGTGEPRRALRFVLRASLPKTDESVVEFLAAQAIFAAALSEPELAQKFRDGQRLLTSGVAGLLAGLTECTPAAAEARAIELLGLADQLAVRLLLGEITLTRAHRIIDGALPPQP